MLVDISERSGLAWRCDYCSQPLRYDVNGPSDALPVAAWVTDAYGSLDRVQVYMLHQRCVQYQFHTQKRYDSKLDAWVPPPITVQTLPYFFASLLRTVGYGPADLDYCDTVMGQLAATVRQDITANGMPATAEPLSEAHMMALLHPQFGGQRNVPTEDDLREQYVAQQEAARFDQESQEHPVNQDELSLDDVPF